MVCTAHQPSSEQSHFHALCTGNTCRSTAGLDYEGVGSTAYSARVDHTKGVATVYRDKIFKSGAPIADTPPLNFMEAANRKLSKTTDVSVTLPAIQVPHYPIKGDVAQMDEHGYLSDVQHSFPEMVIVTQKSEFVA